MIDVDESAEPESLRRASLTARMAAVGTLAEGLAHEVNNPLNCALLQLAVLQRRLTHPDLQQSGLEPVAELVEQALRRLEQLFNDFVAILKPQATEHLPLAAGDQCAGTVTLVRAEADGLGMRVVIDLALDLPPPDGRLQLMLANLWPGAVQMSAGGRMTLRARTPDTDPDADPIVP